jgi:hypothetical protein
MMPKPEPGGAYNTGACNHAGGTHLISQFNKKPRLVGPPGQELT